VPEVRASGLRSLFEGRGGLVPTVQSRIEGEPMSEKEALLVVEAQAKRAEATLLELQRLNNANAALRAQVEELRAAWDAVAEEFPGPHEGWLTDTPKTLMLQAVRGLKAKVAELTRDLGQVQRWADGLVTETQRLQGIEQRAEQAEAKLAKVVEVLEQIRGEAAIGQTASCHAIGLMATAAIAAAREKGGSR
jgi:DNA repair exonuclease SbcCD ATPase subunit